MKKHLFILTLVFFTGFHLQAQPPLYLYIVSHNEDNIGYLNGIGGHNNYLNARNALINVCNMVQAKNLKYNYGADHVALRAIAQYDTGAVITNTNNKNLVQWMVQDMGVECDPHSHETTYNYPDVAYFMSQLGVTPSNTMSGFLYNQLQNGNSWEDYQTGATGDSFPSFTWYPEILWGAATMNHLNDPLYYGVYRPLSMANFNVHEPTNHLILCGTGCAMKLYDTSTVASLFDRIKNTADAIQNGTLPSNGIYTQEIFFSEGNVDDLWFYPLINQLTDSIATLVAAGKVEWKNISEIVDIWKTTFNNQPFAMDCNWNIILQPTGINEFDVQNSTFKVFPNPSAEGNLQLTVSKDLLEDDFKIMDVSGRIILQAEINNLSSTINLNGIKVGVYFISVNRQFQKFVKL